MSLITPFEDAWNTAVGAVSHAVSTGETDFATGVKEASQALAKAVDAGEVEASKAQKAILDLLSGKTSWTQIPDQAKTALFEEAIIPVRNYLGKGIRVAFPQIVYHGKLYQWAGPDGAGESLPTSIAYIAACSLANPDRFARVIGQAHALDGYGEDMPVEVPPEEDTPTEGPGGTLGGVSGSDIPEVPDGSGGTDPGSDNPPPPPKATTSPDTLATISSAVSAIVAFAKSVIGFFGLGTPKATAPASSPTTSPTTGSSSDTSSQKKEDDGSTIYLIVIAAAIWFLFFREEGEARRGKRKSKAASDPAPTDAGSGDLPKPTFSPAAT